MLSINSLNSALLLKTNPVFDFRFKGTQIYNWSSQHRVQNKYDVYFGLALLKPEQKVKLRAVSKSLGVCVLFYKSLIHLMKKVCSQVAQNQGITVVDMIPSVNRQSRTKQTQWSLDKPSYTC